MDISKKFSLDPMYEKSIQNRKKYYLADKLVEDSNCVICADISIFAGE